MFVFNDATNDARVLREAGSLAAAGHQVTVMARPRDLAAAAEEVEQRDGFAIVRVPVGALWRVWWVVMRQPRSAPGFVAATVQTQIRRFPRGWLVLGGLGIGGLLALPFVLARGGATAVRRARGRPGPAGGGSIEYLGRWAFTIFGWAHAAERRAPPADVHHGHDLTGLPAAVGAAKRDHGTVVYDSHEIFLESGSHLARPRPIRALFGGLERGWARRSAALVTVNQSIAEELERRLHPKRIVVVHNCPPRWDTPSPRPSSLSPSSTPPDLIRGATGIPAGAPIALYHGRLTRDRGVEQLAAALLEPGMERVHGVLMGYGPERPKYEHLARDGRFAGRLHLLEAVAPEDLLPWVASADVGIVAIQRTSLNHWLATPNKLFECLAAGLPVVASDFPEMRRIIREDPGGPLGALCDAQDVAALAAAVRSIVEAPAEEREALRLRCLTAAHERWNWESEAVRLVSLYEDLTESRGQASADARLEVAP
jgi:glycosyltransferase involved in cell wall biosynthesis